MKRRSAQVILVMLLALCTLGADNTSPRFEKLGHRLMCTCGCNQILLECNHVGCPSSDGMRNELSGGIKNTPDDGAVLELFVQKYGPIVLAAPTMTGFNRVAWIAPYAFFVLGIALVVFVARTWKRRPAVSGASSEADEKALEDFRRKAREETEL